MNGCGSFGCAPALHGRQLQWSVATSIGTEIEKHDTALTAVVCKFPPPEVQLAPSSARDRDPIDA